MGAPTISLSMIVKNEADNLPRLFQSIRGCFNEINIVDTGSTDGTLELLKKWSTKGNPAVAPLRVHHFEWIHDYAAARNFAFSKCQTDFIMWMDGDDTLYNAEEFRKWKQEWLSSRVDVWYAKYPYLSKLKAVNAAITRERVIRRSLNLQWVYPVHEVMLVPDDGSVYRLFTTKWCILHRHRKNRDQLKTLKDLKRLDESGYQWDGRMMRIYGRELFNRAKDFEGCISFMKKSLDMPDLPLFDQISAYDYLARATQILERYDESIEYCDRGLEIRSDWAAFHHTKGMAYFRRHMWAEALPCFEAARRCVFPEQTPIPVYRFHYGQWPTLGAATCYFELGDLDKAESLMAKLEWEGEEEKDKVDSLRQHIAVARAKSNDRIAIDGTGQENGRT